MAETACRLLDLPVRYRVPRAEDVTAAYDGELGWAYIPNRSVVSNFGVPPRRIPSHFDDIGARVRARRVSPMTRQRPRSCWSAIPSRWGMVWSSTRPLPDVSKPWLTSPTKW